MGLHYVGRPILSDPNTWEVIRIRAGYIERYEVIDRRGRTIGVPHHTRASAERYIENARQKENA